MASNYFKIRKGINLEPVTSAVSVTGDLAYNSATGKLELYNGAVDPVVNEAKAATLTNKTLSGNTATNLISGSGTLTLNTTGTITVPNATDTLVGKATSDTLTNKSLSTNGTNSIDGTSFSGVTGNTNLVMSNSPTLVTPNLGTPTTLVGTNITGTASGLTAGTVTTNANLTGVITSSGNTTSITSQTGTGTKFVVDTSPTISNPTISAVSSECDLLFRDTNGSPTFKSWRVSNNRYNGSALEFTISTTNGGTTDSIPSAFALLADQNAIFKSKIGIAQTDPNGNGIANAKNLVIGDSTVVGNTGITLLTDSATPGNSRIVFSRSNAGTAVGQILYTHAGTENLTISQNGTNRIRLDGSSTPVQISGNTAVSAAFANTGYALQTSTGNFTIADNITYQLVDATQLSVSITMPANPIDGQLVTIALQQNTILTVLANSGQSIKQGAISGVATGEYGTWIYRLTNTTWYRTQ